MTLLLGCATLSAPQAEVDLDRWHRFIAPDRSDLWYGRQAWLPDAGAGLYAAAAEQRPLLLWLLSGNPLHCECPAELAGHRSVWADPSVDQFLAEFVPAVDSIYELLTRPEPASRWVSELLGESPTSGIYMISPSGTMLAVGRSLVPGKLLETLATALERWYELDSTQQRPGPELTAVLSRRPEEQCPVDGLVLTRYARELPPAEQAGAVRSKEWSRDQVWFSASEARALLPRTLAVGETGEVPKRLVRRLARLHFLDDIRGPAMPFSAEQVEVAELQARLVFVDRREVRVAWQGKALAAGADRGLETQLSGEGTFDRTQGRFIQFRLLALGTRWGRGADNGRVGQEAPSPIGFALELTPATSLSKVAPKFVDEYEL